MFLLGSGPASASPPYRWLADGKLLESGRSSQLFRMGSAKPLRATQVTRQAGRWGSALTVEPGGELSYARESNLDLNEGTVEMWVALLNPSTSRSRALFSYRGLDSNELTISEPEASGWRIGERHHVAFTFSAADRRQRLYVDGVLAMASRGGGQYRAPAATGDRFTLGNGYAFDELRTSSRAMSAAEVRANAERLDAPRDNEVLLPASRVTAGSRVVFESAGCTSEPYVYRGVPLVDADPPSTLLPPQSTTFEFSVDSLAPASCAYSVGTPVAYSKMTAFQSGQGTTVHKTTIAGLDPDTMRVNDVYVRCNSDPEYTLHLKYRSLPRTKARFPRTGNLWGTAQIGGKGLEHAARIDLHLGTSFSAAEIRRLRELNPNILILTSINTVENSNLPEDYYLHDTKGHKIEVWPGTFRLNLTKKYVAEYQARYAYERILDLGLMVDGCFFDNFFTGQSSLRADIHGNPVQLDADGDGKEDDPKWLDSTWREGVFYELRAWRKLMPYALASGHLPRPASAEIMEIFNGDSIGFMTAQVLESQASFVDLWDIYNGWFEHGRKPVLMMVESAPHNQIGYGYDYRPLEKIPPSTLEFARTYFPYVRFGLALTLMNDGYFAHEFGDTSHGNDWWYDELDFNLGQPLGPAKRAAESSHPAANVLGDDWTLQGAGATLTHEVDSLLATLSGAPAVLGHASRTLRRAVRYDFSFRAKSDGPRSITVMTQRRSAGQRGYGASRTLELGPEWAKFEFPFEANENAEARVQFLLGAWPARVWVRDVRLVERAPDVYRRDFENGTVLLNGTRQRQTIKLGPGYRRLRGQEAPRHEYIVDDIEPVFSAKGDWREVVYDSGLWKSKGPFYHNWGKSCHETNGTSGTAEWKLSVPADGTYTLSAWWPAAPSSGNWSSKVVYEVWSGGKLLASKTLDQTKAGDEWHEIAGVPLATAGAPVVRVRNEGAGPIVADALYVRSAARYNDGSPAPEVTLEPMDGIILQREKGM